MSDLFGSLFSLPTNPTDPKAPRPLPQIRGRVEGDVLWVRATDVADALESQAPAVNRRLIDKLRRRPR